MKIVVVIMGAVLLIFFLLLFTSSAKDCGDKDGGLQCSCQGFVVYSSQCFGLEHDTVEDFPSGN
jgi:hypothetical protein